MADLSGLSRKAAEGGIFCDFDGSLSAIVPDPADARPIAGATRVLSALARRFRVVAVISGRPARFLAAHVHAPGVHLVGLHGMEEIVDGSVRVAAAAEAARERVDAAAAALTAALRGVRGAHLEHKGLVVTVHFRRAPGPEDALSTAKPIVERIAMANGLAVLGGRLVCELVPPAAGDKGDAVRSLIEGYGLGAALYAGDDTGDLPAFAALDRLELAVRVAVASDESPPELTDRADVVVGSPQELLALLRKLTI